VSIRNGESFLRDVGSPGRIRCFGSYAGGDRQDLAEIARRSGTSAPIARELNNDRGLGSSRAEERTLRELRRRNIEG